MNGNNAVWSSELGLFSVARNAVPVTGSRRYFCRRIVPSETLHHLAFQSIPPFSRLRAELYGNPQREDTTNPVKYYAIRSENVQVSAVGH